MSAQVASSAARVGYSGVRQIAEIAMQMDGVLKLYFGESSLPTPEYLRRAAQKAMADGYLYYTENAGLPTLRNALAAYYERLQHVTLDPASEIVVTNSGVQALNVTIRSVLDPGDEAIILTPAWCNQGRNAELANGVVREVPLVLCNGRYTIDFDALEAAVTPRSRLLIYTSPSNPLGWVATEQDQERLLDFTRRHNLWLLADEVYDRLYYGAGLGTPAASLLRKCTREDAVIIVQSFSKAWCMTGWRVGWVITRRDLARKVTQLNEFIISSAPSFCQRAAETALEWGEIELKRMLARYKDNRDVCLAALRKMPRLTVPETDGAFYLFPRVHGVTDSFEFCRVLLEETQVGLAPGSAFGAGGEACVRICYAADREILAEAMQRLGDYLA
ncbi:MAG TPA: pyridoxal phosphate-dependent aminotransferase [Bryobacteraceae bacterium]|nr:pyridoxal phosphate-dependent aminotransferase [Bryobacteraceae bacterium]